MSPYSVRMRENAEQNNSEYGHFTQCCALWYETLAKYEELNYFWFQLHKSTTSLLNIIMTLPKEFRYFWNGVAKSGTLN